MFPQRIVIMDELAKVADLPFHPASHPGGEVGYINGTHPFSPNFTVFLAQMPTSKCSI